MRHRSRTKRFAIRGARLFLWVAIGSCLVNSTPGAWLKVPSSAEVKTTPIQRARAGQPLALELRATPEDSCEEMTIGLRSAYRVEYLGDTVWTVPATVGQPYVDTIQIVLPDTGKCGIRMHVYCGRLPNLTGVDFIVRPDSVIQLGLRTEDPPKAPERPNPIDTLTKEQLSTTYKVFLNPANLLEKQDVEGIIQRPLTEELKAEDGRYRLDLELRYIVELLKLGYERVLRFISPAPFGPEQGKVNDAHDSLGSERIAL